MGNKQEFSHPVLEHKTPADSIGVRLPGDAIVTFRSNLGRTGYLRLLMDTGAGPNLINERSLCADETVFRDKTMKIHGVCGGGQTVGTCRGMVLLEGYEEMVEFQVMTGGGVLPNVDGILGRTFLNNRAILDCHRGRLELRKDATTEGNPTVINERRSPNGIRNMKGGSGRGCSTLSSEPARRGGGTGLIFPAAEVLLNGVTDQGPEMERQRDWEFKAETLMTKYSRDSVSGADIRKVLPDAEFLIGEPCGYMVNLRMKAELSSRKYVVGNKEDATKRGNWGSCGTVLGNNSIGSTSKYVSTTVTKIGFMKPKDEELYPTRSEWDINLLELRELHRRYVTEERQVSVAYTGRPISAVCFGGGKKGQLEDIDESGMVTIDDIGPHSDEDEVFVCGMATGGEIEQNRKTRLVESLNLESSSNESSDWLKNLCQEFDDIFHMPGDRLTYTNLRQFKIPLQEGATVVNQKQYRMPEAHKEEGKRTVEELMENDIAEESISPYNSPVVMVPKKGLDSSGRKRMRMCVDFRKLNKIIVPYAYPLPQIEDILQQLGRCVWFSSLDLASGYHQVLIDPVNREKTAFSVVGRHLMYKRMPFGISSAPGFFQALITSALHNLNEPGVFAYIDDIVVASDSTADHERKLRAVFNRMRKYRLKLGPGKCRFLQRQITYLGHVCSNTGIMPNPELVKAVQEHPQPRNEKETRSFLGLCNYYRKFVKGFAEIARPLTALTKKDVEFKFNDECVKAFWTLRKKLSSEIVLAYPDFTKEFHVCVDANQYALGGVLEQEGRPIAYGSRALNAAERRYSTIDRELFAIVWATRLWRHYLLGRHFKVYSDHKPLRGIIRVKDATARILRFHQRLSEYNYEIIYRAGKQNTNADALSRIRGSEEVEDDEDFIEFCHMITRRQQKKLNADMEQMKMNQVSANEVPVPGTNTDSVKISTVSGNEEHVASKLAEECKGKLELSDGVLRLESRREIETVLREHHDSLLGGHYGVEKTYDQIKKRFKWKGMRKDVEEYVRGCDICQRVKSGRRYRAPLVVTSLSEKPFDKLYFDVVGPLPPSGDEGYKYILSMCDCLSRFVVFRPMCDYTAETTARGMFEEIICKFLIPKVIVTDNGTNFVSQMMAKICKMLGVKQIRTTPYHPQSNVVERQHRSLGNYLRAFVDRRPADWHELLPSAAFAHNASVNKTLGVAPMELVFGFRSVFPTSVSKGNDEGYSYHDYKINLQCKLKLAWKKAREHAEKEKLLVKSQHDKHAFPREFHIGDQVLVRAAVRANKLSDHFEGPYNVVEVHGNENVTILARGKLKRLHVNRIKLYYPSLVCSTREEQKAISREIKRSSQGNGEPTTSIGPSVLYF